MTRQRAPELDFLRAVLVGGVIVFHAVHVFDPLDFDVRVKPDFPIPLDGAEVTGSFEPAHLWFLAYLFAFSIVLLPLLWRLRGGWARVTPALVVACRSRCSRPR